MNNGLIPASFGIQSTAGAVMVKNEKGEMSMQKVKVHRYVSGKRPDYAVSSSEEESDGEDFIEALQPKQREGAKPQSPKYESDEDNHLMDVEDPRLRRLGKSRTQIRDREGDLEEDRQERRRHIHEPEIIDFGEEEVREEKDESSDEGDLSEEEIDRRRELLREKLLTKREQEEIELMDKDEENKSEESEEESSEYEEYTDSEEETGPRLKPVFVRKRDRITVAEKEKELQKQRQMELEAKRMAEERRRQTVKMVEEDIRKEQTVTKQGDEPMMEDVKTDDENDEVEYEAWKLRELKRIKRDREEREQMERERVELEKVRNMTEEERRADQRNNPKVITNKSAKGKYKFLQKYYHRGAFYLNEEQEVFKRDFSSATLEDHFDKTILPKVMQVKNFGRSGRTKYTHLVDQDTTQFDSPWASDSTQNVKFYNNQAAGTKHTFDKPTKVSSYSKRTSK